MDARSSSGARKRSRSLHQQADSIPPSSGSSPLVPSKRRRVDASESSPPSTNTIQALKSAIGGVFGFGRRKENALTNSVSDLENIPTRKAHKALHDHHELDEL